MELTVEQHYGSGGILDRIIAGLMLLGKDPKNLTIDDLAPVDEFHSRGRVSTTELIELAPPLSGEFVLDIGCGLGGSARYLAQRCDCRVTGVDLTQEYIDVAKRLTEWVAMESQANFIHGSALKLPVPDGSFDKVWTEHAQMNIEDKTAFYNEIARVLKPNGHLLFHDIFAGNNPPDFPLPWAEEPAISHLATEEQAKQHLQNAGLNITAWVNKVDDSLAAFQTALKKIAADGPPPIGIHLLMGDSARQKIENYVASMSRGDLSVAMGVAVKATG